MRPEPAIRREAAVSGKASPTPPKVMTPSATSAAKIERQPSQAPRKPPTAGPTPGARLCTIVSKAMREVASPAAALSRTMARPSTNPPQPPTACPMRAISKVVIFCCPTRGDTGRDIKTEGDEQGRPPPEPVGDRAVQQLDAGDAKEVERDRQLYRAARPRNRRQ